MLLRGATRTPFPGGAEISFNLSHSGGTALFAIALANAVGVDVETRTRPIDELALARRLMGPTGVASLAALEGPARRHAFLRTWTREEAELKCLGTGIGGRTSRAARGLWTTQLTLDCAHVAALASELPPRKLCCWDWIA